LCGAVFSLCLRQAGRYCAVQPPSTAQAIPVTLPAAGEHTKIAKLTNR